MTSHEPFDQSQGGQFDYCIKGLAQELRSSVVRTTQVFHAVGVALLPPPWLAFGPMRCFPLLAGLFLMPSFWQIMAPEYLSRSSFKKAFVKLSNEPWVNRSLLDEFMRALGILHFNLHINGNAGYINEAPIQLFIKWEVNDVSRGGDTFTPVSKGIKYNIKAFVYMINGNISTPWNRYIEFYKNETRKSRYTLALCREYLVWMHIFYAYTGEFLWKLSSDNVTNAHLEGSLIQVSPELRLKMASRNNANVHTFSRSARPVVDLVPMILNANENDERRSGNGARGGVPSSGRVVEITDSDSASEGEDDSGVDVISSLLSPLAAMRLVATRGSRF